MDTTEKSNCWTQILDSLQNQVDKNSFETWLSPTSYIGLEGDDLYIKVPNSYFKDWLSFHYTSLINKVSEQLFGKIYQLKYIIADSSSAFIRKNPYERRTKQGALLNPNLNPNYTFENFIVGSCNQFAHAASQAVAKNPALSYNPFYIYGGAGLGKTHLMNAIGHFVLNQNKRMKILYITTEKFMNDLINHLQYGKILDFRQKYRSVDVLLMDDIHYLSGRERTKEEFFHTFNHLYDSQKQIVISSDCPPKEIPNLEERFSSRFEWGLIADLKPPDIETRIAILQKKSEMEGIKIPESVALFIADKSHSNIRELEGFLRRVIAFSSLKGVKIDLDLAKEALQSLLDSSSKIITVEKIQKIVSHEYKIKLIQIKSKNNSPVISFPRQVAMYLSKELTDASLPEIGKKFGGKHHTTVIHSVRKIEKLRKDDADFNKLLNKLISYIK
ncbi:MAG: chromosomal replication initiator protein DnaA [Acidobacteria bacterium]|nr:chromosomal replication initiator protein DnaA [Acidobacteriota bacterium]MBU1338047.1 chromosomal replication initiator protein DnaA [Acidobacteriota bacterium]MBU4253558.1 chromosomal replication initiator protein DnaA [Acidobacteriota bacterium]MBU4328927.1 chromosomal replication initiator protein DnaA [Acidobacteriota bacterium]MBU4494007.1 chromosomal replication initiator protein DnaA [Acidobacteriota bacterium]